jgi:hypothetical protein
MSKRGENIRFQYLVIATHDSEIQFDIGAGAGAVMRTQAAEGNDRTMYLGGIYAVRSTHGMGGSSLGVPVANLLRRIPSGVIGQFLGIFHCANYSALPSILSQGIVGVGRLGWMATPCLPLYDSRSAGGRRCKKHISS